MKKEIQITSLKPHISNQHLLLQFIQKNNKKF